MGLDEEVFRWLETPGDRAGYTPDSVDGVVSTKLVSRIEHMVFGSTPTRIEVQRKTSASKKPGQRKTRTDMPI
jgi:hypothetical protein